MCLKAAALKWSGWQRMASKNRGNGKCLDLRLLQQNRHKADLSLKNTTTSLLQKSLVLKEQGISMTYVLVVSFHPARQISTIRNKTANSHVCAGAVEIGECLRNLTGRTDLCCDLQRQAAL